MTTTAVETPKLNKRGLPRMQELGLLIVILILGAFLFFASNDVPRNLAVQVKDAAGNVTATYSPETIQQNGFLNVKNMSVVFTYMSWMGIMAIGQTIVIISGGIDISVGSIMGLSAMLTALALQTISPDAPAWQALCLGISVPLAVGAACGFINGSLVVGLRMHPFIVTLATLSIFRWVSLKIGVRFGASLPSGDNVLHPAFTDSFIAWSFPFTRHAGRLVDNLQPVPTFIMLACLILGWIFLRHMVWGRETYAIGGNEEAARFSGIRVGRVKMRVYILSGLAAGVAGMLNCGFFLSGSTNTGGWL